MTASLRSSKPSWKKKATKAWKTSVGNCTTLTNLFKKNFLKWKLGEVFYGFLSREIILFLVLGIFHFYREKRCTMEVKRKVIFMEERDVIQEARTTITLLQTAFSKGFTPQFRCPSISRKSRSDIERFTKG